MLAVAAERFELLNGIEHAVLVGIAQSVEPRLADVALPGDGIELLVDPLHAMNPANGQLETLHNHLLAARGRELDAIERAKLIGGVEYAAPVGTKRNPRPLLIARHE